MPAKHVLLKLSCGHEVRSIPRVTYSTKKCQACGEVSLVELIRNKATGEFEVTSTNLPTQTRKLTAANYRQKMTLDQRERALNQSLIDYALAHRMDPADVASRWWASGVNDDTLHVLVQRLTLTDPQCAHDVATVLQKAREGNISDKALYAAYGERAIRQVS